MKIETLYSVFEFASISSMGDAGKRSLVRLGGVPAYFPSPQEALEWLEINNNVMIASSEFTILAVHRFVH